MSNSAGSEPERASEPPRWRETELALARMQGEIGTNIRERVAALEKGEESLATKADLEKAKLSMITSVAAAGVSILVLVLRFVSWIWPSSGS